MKSKTQKYEEAVARNLRVFKSSPPKGNWSMPDLRIHIGIRKHDARFDEEIRAVRGEK